jgi:hypothetical protein
MLSCCKETGVCAIAMEGLMVSNRPALPPTQLYHRGIQRYLITLLSHVLSTYDIYTAQPSAQQLFTKQCYMCTYRPHSVSTRNYRCQHCYLYSLISLPLDTTEKSHRSQRFISDMTQCRYLLAETDKFLLLQHFTFRVCSSSN